MNNLYKNIFATAVGISLAANAWAQDPHLSQYFNAPMHLNPALTGGIDYDIRVAGHYRNQWATVSNEAFSTMAATAEIGIHQGLQEDDHMGGGLMVMNDQAGVGGLRRTSALLSYAYHKSLGAEGTTYLSIGVQGGIIQSTIDFNKLTFDNQYDGDDVSSALSSGENATRAAFIVGDVSTGIGFATAAAENVNIYLGASLFHLNEPNMGIVGDKERNLERKIHGYIGVDLGVTDDITISPRAVYMAQGQHSQINAGVTSRIAFGSNAINEDPNAFILGVMYRVDNNDAIYPNVRFDYGPIAFSLTYDVNLSKLQRASVAQGGPELAIIYKTNFDGSGTSSKSKDKIYPCPKF
jgi:type IX secretion system PorP/SprF family membrane protein